MCIRDSDSSVRIWDVETGVEIFVFQELPARLMIDASFSDDGESLVTAGVGVVRIRHASTGFSSPYLEGDSLADTIRMQARVDTEDATDEELEEIRESAMNVCLGYPSCDSFTILGIAQYRLGHHVETVESLEEARRLEKVFYRDDLLPLIEGYLALAYHQMGDSQKAKEMRGLFDLDAEDRADDPEIKRLKKRVRDTFGN